MLNAPFGINGLRQNMKKKDMIDKKKEGGGVKREPNSEVEF